MDEMSLCSMSILRFAKVKSRRAHRSSDGAAIRFQLENPNVNMTHGYGRDNRRKFAS